MCSDNDKLMDYYKINETRKEGLNDRLWTQINYYTTILTILIPAFLITLSQYYDSIHKYTLLTFSFSFIPLISILISTIGLLSIQKNFKTLYGFITISNKIEGIYELNNKKNESNNKVFFDEYILPDSYPCRDPNYKEIKSNQFIDANLGYYSSKKFIKSKVPNYNPKWTIYEYIQIIFFVFIEINTLLLVIFIFPILPISSVWMIMLFGVIILIITLYCNNNLYKRRIRAAEMEISQNQ